jgi:hypothetical protein
MTFSEVECGQTATFPQQQTHIGIARFRACQRQHAALTKHMAYIMKQWRMAIQLFIQYTKKILSDSFLLFLWVGELMFIRIDNMCSCMVYKYAILLRHKKTKRSREREGGREGERE